MISSVTKGEIDWRRFGLYSLHSNMRLLHKISAVDYTETTWSEESV